LGKRIGWVFLVCACRSELGVGLGVEVVGSGRGGVVVDLGVGAVNLGVSPDVGLGVGRSKGFGRE
jgi:hypothetical protein